MNNIIYTTLAVISTASAEISIPDGVPEPEGDFQYLLFWLFGFLAFLAWIGSKVYISSKDSEKESVKSKDVVSEIDTQLARDIAENARQIGMLSQAHEFQERNFDDHKHRTEKNINEIFDKVDSMEIRISSKVDGLINAILSQNGK